MAKRASRGRTVAAATAVLALGMAGATDAHAVAGDPQPAARTPAAAAKPAERASDDVDYATWKKDVSAVYDEARPYVEQRISQGGGQKQAIVFDIDNTTLETHFHPVPPTPAVAPSLDLARYAHDHGVAVMFVTARPELIEVVTKANLELDGYSVDGLYERDLGDVFGDPTAFKTAKRAEIEAKGYTIIANIGNSDSDLVGGHAERTFKLPDYDGELD